MNEKPVIFLFCDHLYKKFLFNYSAIKCVEIKYN